METELTDADLVRQIALGHNSAAEAELFRRMAPRIRLYGLRHLRGEHAAEDLTQQVLLTTLAALRAGRLREADKLMSFVLGTCRMTVLDLRRNTQRRERLLNQFVADVPVPAASATPQLDHDALARCVQRLKERDVITRTTIFNSKLTHHAAPSIRHSKSRVQTTHVLHLPQARPRAYHDS